MKIAYFGYREWAQRILYSICVDFKDIIVTGITTKTSEWMFGDNHNYSGYYILNDPKDLTDSLLFNNTKNSLNLTDYDLLLFIGWSWIVPESIIDNHYCICLHPSKLPLYRGGSPIQHQIINGETTSAVTLFRMNNKLDSGEIYEQEPFSLKGDTLNDVILAMSISGYKCVTRLLKNVITNRGIQHVKSVAQNEDLATTYKRRRRIESKLTKEDISKMNTREIHNFIKALQDPYPNAYIEDEYGKVFLCASKYEVTEVTEVQQESWKCKKLIISPHADDEVLGCGGILDSDSFVLYCGVDESKISKDILLTQSNNRCSRTQREEEIEKVSKYLGFKYKIVEEDHVNHYKTVNMIHHIESIINELKPTQVYIPYPSYNQDHKAVYDASLIALRPHDKNFFVKQVLIYEQPHQIMWDSDVLKVNYFVPIDVERKVKAYELHASQVRSFRPPDLLKAIARVRGVQYNCEYAEAFYIQRWG